MGQQPSSCNGNIFGFLLMFLVIVWHPITTSADEVDDERDFDYTKGGPIGPSKWGLINAPLWVACKTGNMQSPIDISNLKVKKGSYYQLVTNYKPSHAIMKNRGHDISLQWHKGQAGSISVNGTDYFLHQAHWHYPTEHAINGKRYDLELHLVHSPLVQTPIKKYAVVGLLYKFGLPNPFLAKLAPHMWALTVLKEKVRKVGTLDPTEIGLFRADYYRYMGSLTTPNCAENVVWSIKSSVMTVSKEQVNLLRHAVHDAKDNARPLQKLNNREITLYRIWH